MYSKFASRNKEKEFFRGAEKERKVLADFRNKLWYVVLLTKRGLTNGSEGIAYKQQRLQVGEHC